MSLSGSFYSYNPQRAEEFSIGSIIVFFFKCSVDRGLPIFIVGLQGRSRNNPPPVFLPCFSFQSSSQHSVKRADGFPITNFFSSTNP